MDFVLRCTWSLKLSPHLDHFNDLEGSIFIMELLEVGRRWIWIFFRVETEWSKSSVKYNQRGLTILVRSNRGPEADEVLLEAYRPLIETGEE